MNITLKQLRAFVTIAKLGSFVQACELLHITQPALSTAIKNLEQNAGGALFFRTTRSVQLTPEGQLFLPTAYRLLQEWDDAFNDLSQSFSLQQGVLSVAAMPSFASGLLPKDLRRYREFYPQVAIKVHDVIAEDAVAMVQAGKVEMALVFEVFDQPLLNFTPLFEDEFVAAIPSALTTVAPHITWELLLKHPFITLQQPSNIRALISQAVIDNQLDISIDYEVNQLATIGQMVAAGLGVSVVPSICKSLFKAQGAHCVSLSKPKVTRSVGVITHARTPLSIAAKTFIKQLVNDYSSMN